MKKRDFLKNMSLMSVGIPLSLTGLDKLVADYDGVPSATVAVDEDFWTSIRHGYKLKDDYINLENGYYCFLPEETLENHIKHIREVNLQGSWYMRTVQWENKKKSVGAMPYANEKGQPSRLRCPNFFK